MTAFTAIAWYNALELLILIFIVFKRYSGLYFWAIFITTLSIVPYQAGAFTKQNKLMSPGWEMLPVFLTTFGWIIMVPGQSLVLYSRLHIVTQNDKLLKLTLRMIIFNAVVLCVPTAVLIFGSNSHAKAHYLGAYAAYEKVQMTMFTLQEFFISGVYIYEVRKTLKLVMEGGTRKMLLQLGMINFIIILLDIALLAVEFANFYQIETTLKGMIYSIKLKIEFGVLSNLVDVVTDKHERYKKVSNININKKFGVYSEDVESFTSIRKASANLNADENIMYPDWRVESEPSAAPVPAHLLDEITEFKEKRSVSRRCSIGEMYPGRLCPKRHDKGEKCSYLHHR